MNLDIYTTEMSKSVWDKAFFMDKIPGVKCVIDFGCADGAMIRYLAPLFPDIMFVGYDISKDLIMRARSTPPFVANLIYFVGNIWDGSHNVYEYVSAKFKPEEICLNFSSVLHEVFSSTGGEDEVKFLVQKLQPRYITIRDMYCDEHIPFASEEQFEAIWGPLPSDKTAEFNRKFGQFHDWRDMTHFLMKLQWVDNGWEDEMKENYYSWNIHNFLDFIEDDYIVSFECRYQLPYLSEMWKQKYNWYNPDIHTHAQFILRRAD